MIQSLTPAEVYEAARHWKK